MSRSRLRFLGLLGGALLAAASPGLVRGDQEDDDRLAKQWLVAVEKYDERQDVVIKHGRRAEFALTILQQEQALAELDATIRDMNTVIAGFPPRRWWIKDQHDYYQLKVAHDARRNDLNRELTALRFQERQLYEEEMRRAETKGRPVKPFHREAILNDLNRLNRETRQAFAALKDGIEAVARKQHTTPGEILQRVGDLARREASSLPEVPETFQRDFVKFAGGSGWLAGAPAGKNKRGPARPKRTRARSDVASF
jgi:hypothetical protein